MQFSAKKAKKGIKKNSSIFHARLVGGRIRGVTRRKTPTPTTVTTESDRYI